MADDKNPKDVVLHAGIPVKAVYGPEDLEGFDPARDLGAPGEFPFTRGIHPEMYRARVWTMRQYVGFGTPRESNARFKYLMARGQDARPRVHGCDRRLVLVLRTALEEVHHCVRVGPHVRSLDCCQVVGMPSNRPVHLACQVDCG